MDEKLERKLQRKNFSTIGWALFVYLLIMNACVLVFVMWDMILVAAGRLGGAEYSEEEVNAILMNNGWGYLVTIAVGLVVLRLWQGKQFFRQTLWTRGKPMTLGDFMCLLALFLGGQFAFSLIATVLETLFNLFGLSLMSSIESATMSADSFSMFLYAGIGAPIAEELLFRGLVLRKLEPYGKRFAIVMSALVFGVFHGNLVQIPYAFLVGLVLGYTALEYNILWAMVLHMINNLVLADMITRLTSFLPEMVGSTILGLVIMASAAAALVILIVRNREIGAYRRENRIDGKYTAAFFTSPGIIALLVYALFAVASPLVSQVLDNLSQAAMRIS